MKAKWIPLADILIRRECASCLGCPLVPCISFVPSPHSFYSSYIFGSSLFCLCWPLYCTARTPTCRISRARRIKMSNRFEGSRLGNGGGGGSKNGCGHTRKAQRSRCAKGGEEERGKQAVGRSQSI